MQLNLLDQDTFSDILSKQDNLGLTFRDSKSLPIHRWNAYVEGFSADYIASLITDIQSTDAHIYDPFGGSGTVCVIASNLGYRSSFSELNPYMRFVAEAKVNTARWAYRNKATIDKQVLIFLNALFSKEFDQLCDKVDLTTYECPGSAFVCQVEGFH